MNEELKIIIRAITADAQKNLQGVKKELKEIETSGKKGGNALASLGKGAKAAAVAVAAVAATIVGVSAAIVNAAKSTADYRKSMAQLTSAFQASGASAAQAKKTYNELYRFLGETDTAVEASNLLVKLTNDEKNLAEWTNILQGVYATFPDSLPIEGLAESANETARVGKVTGVLADALNWAGKSEDEFNNQLATTNSLAEREKLLRETLNGLYGDAAALYERNAAATLAQNEAQSQLNDTLAKIGNTVTPLLTALTNLANSLLKLFAPAIKAVIPYIVTFINAISKAVNWVVALINALTGKNKTVEVTEQLATNTSNLGSNLGNAASGAGTLASGLNTAKDAAEKLKRVTAGFDELNVISNPNTSSSSTGGSSGGGTGGGVGGSGGGVIGGGISVGDGLTDALDEGSASAERFAKKIKAAFDSLKAKIKEWAQLFKPAAEAWKGAFKTMADAWENTKGKFASGFETLKGTFSKLGGYILNDFIPSVVNSFSENLAPVIGDVFGASIEQAGADFQWFADLIDSLVNEVIIPVLEGLKTVAEDVFAGIKKAWDKNGGELLKNLKEFFENCKTQFNIFYEKLLLPIWNKIKKVFSEVWQEGLKPLFDELSDAFTVIGTEILNLYNKVVVPVANWFMERIYPIIAKVIGWIIQKVGDAITTIAGIITGIIRVIKGVVQFISGVFTGDWKKAWTGVKNIFSGIWEAIKSIVKKPLNTIITGINAVLNGLTTAVNTVIKALNKLSFKIPDWVPKYGGQKWGFNIKELKAPQIPKLATGGIVTAETLARIGEGGKKEAVLPLEQNTGWMDALADKIAARNNTPTKIVLELDGKELGYATIGAINGITKQTGKLQLAIV